ncbi:exodeoxyribonuclease VII large subunit [Lachnospiraceae bacterium oral taxon 500]|nr:exodeoxyribonuclease VII large subunit [Lachnospiraceae bacterium oral taxon 500]
MAGKIFQVSEVNLYIKNLFRDDFLLNHLQIEGEVSNAKRHTSGHIYFTLKDEAGAIACVLFAGYAGGVELLPQNGEKVVVTGGVGVYEKTGSYQVYVREIRAGGRGDLAQKLEALKQKLAADGIFGKPKKRLPLLPERIGLVTSATGAALQDILQIAGRRNPGVQLILYPSLVQGERAAANIAAGIEYFNRQKEPVDVLIIGRGGGSLEDLWAFNEEAVVRAIFHSGIPVISAVGHETDVTLSDLAADLRAPTPSAAAELAIPEQAVQRQKLNESRHRLDSAFRQYGGMLGNEIEQARLRLTHYHPRRKWEELTAGLAGREKELNREFRHYLRQVRWELELKQKELTAAAPQAKLTAGYAYLTAADGRGITTAEQVQAGDLLQIYLRDGRLTARVEEKESGGKEKRN